VKRRRKCPEQDTQHHFNRACSSAVTLRQALDTSRRLFSLASLAARALAAASDVLAGGAADAAGGANAAAACTAGAAELAAGIATGPPAAAASPPAVGTLVAVSELPAAAPVAELPTSSGGTAGGDGPPSGYLRYHLLQVSQVSAGWRVVLGCWWAAIIADPSLAAAVAEPCTLTLPMLSLLRCATASKLLTAEHAVFADRQHHAHRASHSAQLQARQGEIASLCTSLLTGLQ
jgi:hypothetical protein